MRMLKAHSKARTPVPKVSKLMKRTLALSAAERVSSASVSATAGKVLGFLTTTTLLHPCRLVSQSLRQNGFDLCKRQRWGIIVGEHLRRIEVAVASLSLHRVEGFFLMEF